MIISINRVGLATIYRYNAICQRSHVENHNSMQMRRFHLQCNTEEMASFIARHYVNAVYATALCLSVCLSACAYSTRMTKRRFTKTTSQRVHGSL